MRRGAVAKAMDTFDLDPARWPELAADRGAWRTMLRSGEAPLGFRQCLIFTGNTWYFTTC